MSWLVFSFSDVHPKEWPKSNIKRFVSKFMKTFRTILQCYLIQINIAGQFIAIIGVRKKWLLFLFFTANLPCYCGLVNCLLSSHQLLSKLYLAITWLWPALCFLVNITLPNLFQFIPPRRVNNKILIFMETFSDSFHHFYVSVSLSFPS